MNNKIAYVDGKLLMEVHPPVDGEGQTAEGDLEVMSQTLRRAPWDKTLRQFTGTLLARRSKLRRVCPRLSACESTLTRLQPPVLLKRTLHSHWVGPSHRLSSPND